MWIIVKSARLALSIYHVGSRFGAHCGSSRVLQIPFFERDIVRQINNSDGLYLRYIDDIFIKINRTIRHFIKEVDRLDKFDSTIKLSAYIRFEANFLDLYMQNQDGQLFTTVYHKPSYEPYYLPFNSVHPMRMKKNIPYAMLRRAIRYCSTLQAYVDERGKLRMDLLLNKYPSKIIAQQFNLLLQKYNINQTFTIHKYSLLRQQVLNTSLKEKLPSDYGITMFVHFTYCTSMTTFPKKFHSLWNKYFSESSINDITPVLGTRNIDNLQQRLVHKN